MIKVKEGSQNQKTLKPKHRKIKAFRLIQKNRQTN